MQVPVDQKSTWASGDNCLPRETYVQDGFYVGRSSDDSSSVLRLTASGFLSKYPYYSFRFLWFLPKISSSRCAEASPQQNPSTTVFRCGDGFLWVSASLLFLQAEVLKLSLVRPSDTLQERIVFLQVVSNILKSGFLWEHLEGILQSELGVIIILYIFLVALF